MTTSDKAAQPTSVAVIAVESHYMGDHSETHRCTVMFPPETTLAELLAYISTCKPLRLEITQQADGKKLMEDTSGIPF